MQRTHFDLVFMPWEMKVLFERSWSIALVCCTTRQLDIQ